MTAYQTYYNLFVSNIALAHQTRTQARERARAHQQRILELLSPLADALNHVYSDQLVDCSTDGKTRVVALTFDRFSDPERLYHYIALTASGPAQVVIELNLINVKLLIGHLAADPPPIKVPLDQFTDRHVAQFAERIAYYITPHIIRAAPSGCPLA